MLKELLLIPSPLAVLLFIFRLAQSSTAKTDINEPPTIVDFFNENEPILSVEVRRYESANPTDYFRMLHSDDDHVVIGGADLMYNISLETFTNVSIYRWTPATSVFNDCTMKNSDESICRNYVRVLAHTSNGSRMICGTNAFHPRCRLYYNAGPLIDESSVNEFTSVGLLPFDPRHNATARMDGNFLYAATTSDFAGTDALIFRRDVAAPRRDPGLRTQRHNDAVLNRPLFVGQLHTTEFAYFFFREEANEADGAPATYSRVARVCKGDRGGPRNYYETEWTSFIKARLNCSIPERNRPFYFDEIVAISEARRDADGRMIFYATFVSEFEFLRHSVICAFDLATVNRLFTNSELLVIEAATEKRGTSGGIAAKWTRRNRDDPVRLMVGQCQADSRNLAEETAVQLRRLTLIADAVPSIFFNGAVGIRRATDRYSQIAVLNDVKFNDGAADVLYVATDHGNIIKMVNLAGFLTENTQSLTIEDDPLIQVSTFKIPKTPIHDLFVNARRQILIVITDTAVYRLPLAACMVHTTCAACVASRDPHCVWHDFACVRMPLNVRKRFTYQDVLARRPKICADVAAREGKETRSEVSLIRFDVSNNVRHHSNSNHFSYSSANCRCANGVQNCTCVENAPLDIAWNNENGTAFDYFRSLLPSSVRSVEFGLWVIVIVGLAAAQTLAFSYFCCKLTAACRKQREKKVKPSTHQKINGEGYDGIVMSTTCDVYEYSNHYESYCKPNYKYNGTRSMNCSGKRTDSEYNDADERAVASATLGRPPTAYQHQSAYGRSTYSATTLPSLSSSNGSTNVTHLSSFCESSDESLLSVARPTAPLASSALAVQLQM